MTRSSPSPAEYAPHCILQISVQFGNISFDFSALSVAVNAGTAADEQFVKVHSVEELTVYIIYKDNLHIVLLPRQITTIALRKQF